MTYSGLYPKKKCRRCGKMRKENQLYHGKCPGCAAVVAEQRAANIRKKDEQRECDQAYWARVDARSR